MNIFDMDDKTFNLSPSIPFELSHLALEAFGEYVSDMTLDLLHSSQHLTTDMLNLQLNQTCLFIKNIIQSVIPPRHANVVSTSLQTRVLNSYNYFEKSFWAKNNPFDKDAFKSQCCNFKLVLQKIICAVTHPSLSVFKFSKDQVEYVMTSYEKKFSHFYLDTVLTNVTNISVLEFDPYSNDEEVILNNLNVMQNLQELVHWSCSDIILDVLSDVCTQLKKLDIRYSRDVTDSSIKSILKFEQLKILKLTQTSITEDGMTIIMRDLSNSAYLRKEANLFASDSQLTTWESKLNSFRISFLVECFSNLTTLGVDLDEPYSLKPFKDLKYLKTLKISAGIYVDNFFNCVMDLLIEIGKQLLELELHDIMGTNLAVIAENCPFLQHIGLYYPEEFYLGFPSDKTLEYYANHCTLPEFPSIRSCKFEMQNNCVIKYILSRFVNAKNVSLVRIGDYNKSLLKSLLDEMISGHIQQLYLNETVLQVSGNYLVIYQANGSMISADIKDWDIITARILMQWDIEYVIPGFTDL